MTDPICCVCHQPVPTGARRLGSRSYCPAHYEKVTRQRSSPWAAGVVQLLSLLILVGVVELILVLIPFQPEGVMLLIVSLVLAVLPSLLWLAFFYRQDRLEPEPKGYVLGVFALGGLLAAAVGIPLLRDLFRVSDWLGTSPWVHLLGAILVVGFSQEFLKYAAVRYSVFPLAEFDERTDGIIYGTAAGLGFAAVLNLDTVIQGGGLGLEVGVITVVVTALAQASFAGLSGYFLGRSKFELKPWWWMLAGLALAACGNGLFIFLRGEVTRSGLTLAGGGFNPWPGLGLATAVALVVFFLLNRLIRRDIAVTLQEGKGGSL